MTILDSHPSVGVLYHVTTVDSVDGIVNNGIDPDRSTGKLKASWYVSKNNIQWAILHVCNRHHREPADVFVCRTVVNWSAMRRTAKPNVFYTLNKYSPEDISPATWFIDLEVN